MVLSLVLAGVSLAAAADVSQTPKIADLNGVTKISDQEGQNIRGTGLGAMNMGALGTCTNVCTPTSNLYNNNYQYLTPGPHKVVIVK